MENPFSWLKYYLSHVSKESLRYRMVNKIWGDRTQGKACSFYWIKLPTSIFIYLAAVAITVISFFFGVVPTFIKPRGKGDDIYDYYPSMFYPYKKLPGGKRILVAPWEAISIMAVLSGIYYLVFVNQDLGIQLLTWAAIVGVGVATIVAICYLLGQGWKRRSAISLPPAVGETWDKICPGLEVEDQDKKEEEKS